MERREEERCIVAAVVVAAAAAAAVVVVDVAEKEMWQRWGQQKRDACLVLGAAGTMCTAAAELL